MFYKKKFVGGILLSTLITSSLAGCFSSEKEADVVGEPKLQVKLSNGDTITLQYQRNRAGARSGEDTQATYNIHVLKNINTQEILEDLCPSGFILDHGNSNRPFKVGSTLHCYHSDSNDLVSVDICVDGENASSDLVSVDIGVDGEETFSNRTVVTNLELIWEPKSAEINLKQQERGNGLMVAVENARNNDLPIERRYNKSEFQSLIEADFNALIVELQKELKRVENNTKEQEENASSWK